MPIARFEMPDGRVGRFEVPEGTTPEQAHAMIEESMQSEKSTSGQPSPLVEASPLKMQWPPTSLESPDKYQNLGNAAAGMIRGAGSIGSTLLAPYDMAKDALAGKGLTLESNRQRRAEIEAGLQEMGAQPESTQYQGGKLAGEIAGTAGVGGVLANGVRAVAPGMPALANAIATSGMKAGSVPGAANMLTRMTGGAITGGVTAGLIDPSTAGTGAAIGGAMPPAMAMAGKVGSLAGKAGNVIRGKDVSPEVANLAQRAKELGIDIPADRLANSKPLDAVASGLNYLPFSGRAATEANMNKQLNRALSRTFGQDTDNITLGLRKASQDLGSKFETTLRNNTVKVDNQFLNDLVGNLKKAQSELSPSDFKIIENQANEIINKAQNGVIDGQAAYNIKKTLDRIGNRRTNDAWYALDMKKSLMGALDRSLGPDAAKEFATVRQHYGNMLDLEKIAKNGAEGEISVARLANMKNINNKPLQEIADIAAQFVKPREGQHGAMQRAAAGIGVGSIGGAPGLAATAATGRTLNTLMNSNMAKKFILNTPSQPNTLAQLMNNPDAQQLLYRSAPVIGVR